MEDQAFRFKYRLRVAPTTLICRSRKLDLVRAPDHLSGIVRSE